MGRTTQISSALKLFTVFIIRMCAQLGSNWSGPVYEGQAWLQSDNCLYFYLGLLAENTPQYLATVRFQL